jgi:MFS family permease
MELIFPFVNQMIVELGILDDPSQVGYYSGLIESLYSTASLLTIIPCGYLSDHIGRKPIILFGMSLLAISVSAFGLARTYLGLVLSRSISGACAGAWAAIRTVVTEITDSTNQGTAFAALTFSYRLGQIIGLPIGGIFAHPERNFPIFRTPFWEYYPFALPCFIGATVAIVGTLLGFILLDETLPSKAKQTVTDPETTPLTLDYGTATTETAASTSHMRDPSTSTAVLPEEPVTYRSVLTLSIISLLLSNFTMVLITDMAFAVYPLFGYTSISRGGLSLSESEIGIQMGMRAFFHVLCLGLYPRLEKKLGSLRMYQGSMLLFPLVVLMFPVLNAVLRWTGGEMNFSFWVIWTFFFMIWAFTGFNWTSMFSLISEATPSQSALATLNSLSQMCIVLPQAIAPAAATSLFAYSGEHPELFRGNLIWIIMFASACVAGLHSLTLTIKSTNWRERRKP